MAKDIVDRCEGCQFYSDMSHKPASALKTIPLVWPFAVWGLDMVGPLRTGKSGFTHVLVAVDKFTKWIEAKPIKNLDASTAVSFIRELTFRYGVPHNIITDNGSNFDSMSSEFSAPLRALESTMLLLLTYSRTDKQKEPMD